jgi:putative transposase
MARTLVSLYVHVIFSTKNRANMIPPEIESELWSYLGGILNNNKSKLLASNGVENHVHLLISLSKNIGLSELVGDLKRDSSKWLKTKGTKFEKFQW